MGNNASGMTPPDPAQLEADYFQTLVGRLQARLQEDGTVDPASVAFSRVLREADSNLREMGGDPQETPGARHQQFVEVLRDLRLPEEARDRLETQYHFRHGDGHRALEEVGGRLGDDGLPDLRSLRADRLEVATADRYRTAIASTPGMTMRGQLDSLLDDLRIPQDARPGLIREVHADERHFSWLANEKVPAEMDRSGYPFKLADNRLMEASRHAPLPQDTRDMLIEHADRWGDNLKDIFHNRGAQHGIHLNYPQADVNRTASSIGADLFLRTVNAGYNLSDRDVLTAYCEAVMTQTTEFGHTTQIASRAGGGLEAELGERQINPSFSRH